LTFLPPIFYAFLLEVIDASFGGGYGTILSPMLLMLGFAPLDVVPAILISQLIGDFLSAFFHHEFKSVDLSFHSKMFKMAGVLAALGSLGSILSVILAINLPKVYLSMYIGAIVFAAGALTLLFLNKQLNFSWHRLMAIGFIAAFNKGLSGGGYGPLLTSGQIISGVDSKGAVAVTSLAEGIVCIVAALTYMVTGRSFDWALVTTLSIGVALSAPVSAFIIKKIESNKLKMIIGAMTLVLGLATMLRLANA